jgi:hypothetical protein
MMNVAKMVLYPGLVALGASLGTLLIASCVLGFEINEWPEMSGRIVGVLGTIAGVLGAAVPLALALRDERPATR